MVGKEHIPVLLKEVIDVLNPKCKEIFVDCTLGSGGHAIEILKKIKDKGFLIGIDRDEQAIKIANKNMSQFKNNFAVCNDNYKNISDCLKKLNINKVDGILIDLGFSSMQIDNFERGFSFNKKGLLDMRMDQSQSLTAEEIVNEYSEKELADIFWQYGEERNSRKIARSIIYNRQKERITDTSQLENIIFKTFKIKGKIPKTHPATKAFQALRIVVNDELLSLKTFLGSVMSFLNENGRLCIIAYHSLEDRIVKFAFKEFALAGIGRIYNKKPICPSIEEINNNNRSRSAKLRAFIKGSNNLCIK